MSILAAVDLGWLIYSKPVMRMDASQSKVMRIDASQFGSSPVVLNLFVLEANKKIKNSFAAHFHMTMYKTQIYLFNGTAHYIVVLT